MRRAWALGLAAAAVIACEASEPGTATLRLGLADEEACKAHCVETLFAYVYGYLSEGSWGPLSTAEGPCGEPLTIEGLTIGSTYEIEVFAQEPDTSVSLFSGSTGEVIVPQGSVLELEVLLGPDVSPGIGSVTPDPVVLGAAGGSVTVQAVDVGAIFDTPTFALAGQALESQSTGGEESELTLPPGTPGGPLVLSTCGIDSEAVDLRVLGPTAGLEPFEPPSSGCADAAVVAAVPDHATGFFAVSACDGAGEARPVQLGDLNCTLGSTPWPIADGVPVAAATDPEGEVLWVALAAAGPGSHRVVMLSTADGSEVGDAHVLPAEPLAGGLAVTEDAAYVISGGELLRLTAGASEMVGGVGGSYQLRALAPADGQLLLLGVFGGKTKLVPLTVPPTGAPPAEYEIATCAEPTALAVGHDGAHAAAVCGDTGDVIALSLAGGVQTPVEVDLPGGDATGVAIGDRGELAFVWSAEGGTVDVLDLRDPTPSSLVTWSVGAGGAGGAVSLGSLDRVVLYGLGEIRDVGVLSPYHPTAGCAQDAP